MYMRRKFCYVDRIAITGRTEGCRVDSPQYGQQYLLLCRHRLFGPNFALLKGCTTVYMNLPNAFRTRGSSLMRRNLNALLDSISQMFSYFVDILENILLRSWSYILQMSRKCCSSSTTSQNGHNRSVMGVLGLVYLPRSISNIWELARSLLIAILYLDSLTRYK